MGLAFFQVSGRLLFTVLDELETGINQWLSPQQVLISGLEGDWRQINPVIRIKSIELPGGDPVPTHDQPFGEFGMRLQEAAARFEVPPPATKACAAVPMREHQYSIIVPLPPRMFCASMAACWAPSVARILASVARRTASSEWGSSRSASVASVRPRASPSSPPARAPACRSQRSR